MATLTQLYRAAVAAAGGVENPAIIRAIAEARDSGFGAW